MIKNCLRGMRLAISLSPLLALLLALLSLCIGAVVPLQLYMMQLSVEHILAFTTTGNNLHILLFSISLLLLSFALSPLLKMLHSLTSNTLTSRMEVNLSERILSKLQKIDYAYYEDTNFYDMFEQIRKTPGKELFEFFQNNLSVCGILVELAGIFMILCQFSVVFALIYIAILVYISAMNFGAMHRMNAIFDSTTLEERQQNYYTNTLSDKGSLYELRVYQGVSFLLTKLRDISKQVLGQRLRGTVSAQKYCFLANMGVAVWLACVLGFMFLSYDHAGENIGIFVALLGSVESILHTTENFSSSMSDIARGSKICRDLHRFFGIQESMQTGEHPSVEKITSIEFQHVYFKYPNAQSYALEDVSFRIDATKNYALVGENGSGKTTAIYLLCGLFVPESGVILLNGIPIQNFSSEELAKFLSVVFQNYGRYQLSVRDNIALGELSLRKQDSMLQQAIAFAQGARDFPDLDQMLGRIYPDGVELSGGQWQKLAIARACLAQNKYIVFDEPTASLDPHAESQLYQQMGNLLTTHGCLFISHRMASAAMADCILVMDNHRIAEQGTHASLLQEDGIYAKMFRAQASMYQENSR